MEQSRQAHNAADLDTDSASNEPSMVRIVRKLGQD